MSYLPHPVFDWRFCAISHDSTCRAHTTGLPSAAASAIPSVCWSLPLTVFTILRGPAQPRALVSERISCQLPVTTSTTEKKSLPGSNRRRDIPVSLRLFLLICCTVSKKKKKGLTRHRWVAQSATGSVLFSSSCLLTLSNSFNLPPFSPSPRFSNLFAAPAFKWLHLDCEEF